MLVDGWLDSWFSKTKTIHFNEEQIRSRMSASRRTSDSEELIAKKENLLLSSRLPVENFPIHRQNWQFPSTQT